MDWITQLLARLFETFKMKSPIAASAIILVAALAVKFAQEGTALGLFSLPEWAAQVVTWVGIFLLAVTGSQTFKYLPASARKER